MAICCPLRSSTSPARCHQQQLLMSAFPLQVAQRMLEQQARDSWRATGKGVVKISERQVIDNVLSGNAGKKQHRNQMASRIPGSRPGGAASQQPGTTNV